MNKIKLIRDFWDCKCKENYIKPTWQEYCGKCGAIRTEQPNSRTNEVQRLNPQPKPQLQ